MVRLILEGFLSVYVLLEISPNLPSDSVIIREVGSMSEYERRSPVSALLRGARCLRGPPRPPREASATSAFTILRSAAGPEAASFARAITSSSLRHCCPRGL